jgi:3-oxoacyl-[acyl-carrier-protein] synthase III
VRGAEITGWGMAVPEEVLTNARLEQMVETSDEWIISRTGIRERRIAAPHQKTSDLGLLAARDALSCAGVEPSELDLVILCTATPDRPIPGSSHRIQATLGADHAGAFDLNAGCAGFIYGLSVATSFVRSGSIDSVLLICAETLTRIVDYSDRATCVLFGDAAGALVLQPGEPELGLTGFKLGSAGEHLDILTVRAGGSEEPASSMSVAGRRHFIHMEGQEVFRRAVVGMAEVTEQALAAAGVRAEDLDMVIPHQANQRIIDATAKRLGIPMEKVFCNIDRYGNTSAATIPVALCEALSQEKVKPGALIGVCAFGAGLAWAAAAIRWGQRVVPKNHQLSRASVSE